MSELFAAMINGRPVNRSKNAVRYIGWPWNLEEMPSCLVTWVRIIHLKELSVSVSVSVFGEPEASFMDWRDGGAIYP